MLGNDLGYHTLIVPEAGAVPALSSSPVRSVGGQSARSRAVAGRVADGAPDRATLIAAGLLSVLGQVVDPRKRRGVRHRLATVLAVAVAATLAGARSFTAIAEWAADVPSEALDRLGVSRRPPSEATIRRLLIRLPADTLDTVIGAWMRLPTSTIGGRRVIAFDGKTLRGAKDAAGNLVHLLAGLCQRTGVVLGQVAVGAKTNEIPILAGLLKVLDITGAVITADAMHCQRETAQIIRARGGHYILTVKVNQPSLRKRVKSLPWKDIPALAVSREHGHGRQDTRTLKATEHSGGIGFPGAAQVLRLTRTRTIRATGKRTRETVYAITSLTATDAGPEQIAAWLRGHSPNSSSTSSTRSPPTYTPTPTCSGTANAHHEQPRRNRANDWNRSGDPNGKAPWQTYIAHELKLRLQRRPVVINREVVVTPTDAGDSGQRPDIMVNATPRISDHASDTHELSVPIEIKGTWHKAVLTAQRSQLAKRYLPASKTDAGVYLVGSYPLEHWDATNDKGKTTAKKHAPVDKLHRELTDQAHAIQSETGFRTFPYVLEIPRARPETEPTQ